MSNIESLVAELKSIDQQRDDESYAMDFEAVLAKFIELRSSAIIGPLIDFFDDEAPFDEVMFSIIHTIETFEDETYVRGLLEKAASFCESSPRWAAIVFMRVLNADATQHELVRQLREANDATKAAVRNLMEKINARGVQFVAKTTPVLVAAS